MDKEYWLNLGDVINKLRVVPRILMFVYYIFAGWYITFISIQYFILINSENVSDWKLAAMSAFGAITIPAICGILAKLTDNYFRTP